MGAGHGIRISSSEEPDDSTTDVVSGAIWDLLLDNLCDLALDPALHLHVGT